MSSQKLSTEPVPHLTFAKYVKLAGLATGKYSVVIEARDMAQKKAVKQEAWFVIHEVTILLVRAANDVAPRM